MVINAAKARINNEEEEQGICPVFFAEPSFIDICSYIL